MKKRTQSRTRHASAIDVFVINVTSPTAGFILCSSQIVASLFGEQAALVEKRCEDASHSQSTSRHGGQAVGNAMTHSALSVLSA